MSHKSYVTPAIETLDSSEILELMGPVQGYGPAAVGGSGGQGQLINAVVPTHGGVTPAAKH